VDVRSPSVATLPDSPSGADSTLASGGITTDVGSGAIDFVAGDRTTDAGSDESVAVPLRRPRPAAPAVSGYEIITEIGRGGMGVVYKARHLRLDRIVALKMILAGAHASAEQIARFHTEARAVAQLQHAGIVQIHEDGDYEGLPYFSLGFVPGGSLAQRIGGKPQPPRAAAAMVFVRRLKAEPTSVRARMDVALAHYYVATADLRQGDGDSAMAHYRECRDIREELTKDPKAKLSSLDLMLALARTGDHQRASEIAEAMIKEPPLDARIYFHSACGFALSAGAVASVPASDLSRRQVRHYTKRAVDALGLALKHGWKSVEEIVTDPDLDPIRADPEFVAVLERFRKAGP
jgi:hypothetical protein